VFNLIFLMQNEELILIQKEIARRNNAVFSEKDFRVDA